MRIAYCVRQSQGEELVKATNRIAKGEGWKIGPTAVLSKPPSALPEVCKTHITAQGREFLVCYWYQQGQAFTTNDYEAKGLELAAGLRPSPAAVLAIGTMGSEDAARERLAAFLRLSGPALRDCSVGGSEDAACTKPQDGLH